jgi:hypothetical protein
MIIFYTFLILIIAVFCAELLSRQYWQNKIGIPFCNPSRIYEAFYPELEKVERKRPSRGDGFFNILVLGGSALTRDWGAVENRLAEQICMSGAKNIRIFNLSVGGHTSLDIFYEYTAVKGFSFDLVLFYPGGAEVKVNNVPPPLFRKDYGHFSNNELRNYLIRYHDKAKFSLVYGLRAYILLLRRRRHDNNYVPYRIPRESWTHFGSEIRSTEPFRRNLALIMDMAKQRGEPMIAMTFAFHTSINYSLERFQSKSLEYVLHLLPYEKFGIKDNVIKTLLAHNQVVRSLSAEYENVTLVDQEAMMSGGSEWFNDPMHLTVAGSVRFVENLLPFVLSFLNIDSNAKAVQ